MKEAGYTDIDTPLDWFGIFVPAKTPAAVVAQLNTSIRNALKTEEVRTGLANFAFEPAGESPEEFARWVRSDYEKWARIVKATGFHIEE